MLKRYLTAVSLFTVFLALSMGASKCDSHDQTESLPEGQRIITILGTNDIHGGVDATTKADGEDSLAPEKKTGGMAIWGGIVQAIRKGLNSKYGARAGVLVVDAGDQFQGTLISNYNEGQLVFATMNEIGYDLAVPGNHDFDFGPIGWLDDQVTPNTADKNPRGALERVAAQANFPLLSANTYFKSSIVDTQGDSVDVDGIGCKSKDHGAQIDWSKARRPEILQPYAIKTTADVRVAFIGLDNASTPSTTTAANVADLCFRDEVDAYLDTRKQLEGKADIFVLVIHDGNTNRTFEVNDMVAKIQSADSSAMKGHVLDAVISGHTHFTRKDDVKGIPIIQSGSGGGKFGRIDLVYDPKSREIVLKRAYAGVVMHWDDCVDSAKDFCSVSKKDGEKPKLLYEGVEVVPQDSVQQLIDAGRKDVAPIADRKLGIADGPIKPDRIDESSLGDSLSDVLRVLSGADVAFLNTGGLRAPIDAGDVTYEDLFRVIPFGNQGVVLSPMSVPKLLSILEKSAQTCGDYGALMQSGLKVVFKRDCQHSGGTDRQAKLIHVETISGEVIFDAEKSPEPLSDRIFSVATLDFLMTGGAGYTGFAGVPKIKDLGIVREAMVDYFLSRMAQRKPFRFSPKIDDRWKNIGATSGIPAAPRVTGPETLPARR